ncbi:MAG: hypothetical protein ACR2RF_22030 [Geminicoccaceae bacterium]
MRSRDDLERLLKLKHVDDALLCGGEERVIWDKTVPGLGLRLRSNAKPVWIVQRRIEGRTLKRILGRLNTMRARQAHMNVLKHRSAI